MLWTIIRDSLQERKSNAMDEREDIRYKESNSMDDSQSRDKSVHSISQDGNGSTESGKNWGISLKLKLVMTKLRIDGNFVCVYLFFL